MQSSYNFQQNTSYIQPNTEYRQKDFYVNNSSANNRNDRRSSNNSRYDNNARNDRNYDQVNRSQYQMFASQSQQRLLKAFFAKQSS